MKKMSKYIGIMFLALSFSSCEKNEQLIPFEDSHSLSDEVASRGTVCTITTGRVGELSSKIQNECEKMGIEPTRLTEITIKGPVDQEDLLSLRALVQLTRMNLSQAIMSNKDGNAITEFPAYSFQKFDGFTEVYLPNNITSIGMYAFDHSHIIAVFMANNVEVIDYRAFTGCEYLKSVTLSSALKELGGGAFEACSKLTHLDLPQSLQVIRSQALSRMGLYSIDIPSNTLINEDNVFEGCMNLTSVKWPQKSTTLPRYCFLNCEKLDFVLPNHITKIEQGALQNTAIKELTITKNMTFVSKDAFGGCRYLKSVFWESDAEIPYISVWNAPIIYAKKDVKANPSTINIARGDDVTGYECDEIRLFDDLGYSVSKPVKAKKVVFTRYVNVYTYTVPDLACVNWATICLPYNVTKIIAKGHGGQPDRIFKPFRSENMGDAKPFWLRILTPDGFQPVTTIENNKPYLISFPSNGRLYPPEYNVSGNVEFWGENVVLNSNIQPVVLKGPEFEMHTNYQRIEKSKEIYNLNEDEYYSELNHKYYYRGSIFRANQRDTKPFEAYIKNPVTGRSIIPVARSKSRANVVPSGILRAPDENDM